MDGKRGLKVAFVNASVARRYFISVGPIGKLVRMREQEESR